MYHTRLYIPAPICGLSCLSDAGGPQVSVFLAASNFDLSHGCTFFLSALLVLNLDRCCCGCWCSHLLANSKITGQMDSDKFVTSTRGGEKCWIPEGGSGQVLKDGHLWWLCLTAKCNNCRSD